MKNKFFMCFRPIVLETENQSNCVRHCDDQVCSYITAPNRKKSKISKTKSPISDNQLSRVSDESIFRENCNSSRSFARLIKVVLFVISLKKRVRERKACRLTFQSKKSKSATCLKISGDNPTNPKFLQPDFKQSRANSLPNSSELLNFRSFDMKKQSIEKPHELRKLNREKLGSSSSILVLFWIFITLSVTIFWGRVFALLFALMWLYFLPRRSNFYRQSSEKKLTLQPEIEWCRDNKKRVIMEGMLERNHQRERERERGIKFLT